MLMALYTLPQVPSPSSSKILYLKAKSREDDNYKAKQNKNTTGRCIT